MVYMKTDTQATTHEWWKDEANPAEQRAFLASYRSAQRTENAVAWRRNVMLGFLFVSIPILVRLISTL
ncbi:hypothetical protein C7T35_14410 [Variovorax sp. WS11]|nr:hypothetical protein C7T35_14410 [Variovorax sp. WS11]